MYVALCICMYVKIRRHQHTHVLYTRARRHQHTCVKFYIIYINWLWLWHNKLWLIHYVVVALIVVVCMYVCKDSAAPATSRPAGIV